MYIAGKKGREKEGATVILAEICLIFLLNLSLLFLCRTRFGFGIRNGFLGSNIGGILEEVSKLFENERRRLTEGVARPAGVLEEVRKECVKGKCSATIFATRGDKTFGCNRAICPLCATTKGVRYPHLHNRLNVSGDVRKSTLKRRFLI